jgi:hypothetical protein
MFFSFSLVIPYVFYTVHVNLEKRSVGKFRKYIYLLKFKKNKQIES